MNTVTIKGLTYNIVLENTPDTHEAKGLHNLAREMRKNNIVRDLGIQLPKGKNLYTVYEFKSGHFSKLTKVPGY